MLEALLEKSRPSFHSVVPFDSKKDKLVRIDLTAGNSEITEKIINDTEEFSSYIRRKLEHANAKYGIGGYNEYRSIYSRSTMFEEGDNVEPRRLHLGIDIWGEQGTPVFAPMQGIVHSFAFNDHYGDYGVTIILLHQLGSIAFHTLYGHLSLKDIQHLKEGDTVEQGEQFAHLGSPRENGEWPPHLHFQVIENMESKKGDYPGVCKYSESLQYLNNCPNPDIILNMMPYSIE
jgi:murein DD-endopeptidase MepM/ murein hydrolase activator NlpD